MQEIASGGPFLAPIFPFDRIQSATETLPLKWGRFVLRIVVTAPSSAFAGYASCACRIKIWNFSRLTFVLQSPAGTSRNLAKRWRGNNSTTSWDLSHGGHPDTDKSGNPGSIPGSLLVETPKVKRVRFTWRWRRSALSFCSLVVRFNWCLCFVVPAVLMYPSSLKWCMWCQVMVCGMSSM